MGADTENAFVIYSGNTLGQVSQVGKLCVQLIVDVTNLPADNMAMGFSIPVSSTSTRATASSCS